MFSHCRDFLIYQYEKKSRRFVTGLVRDGAGVCRTFPEIRFSSVTCTCIVLSIQGRHWVGGFPPFFMGCSVGVKVTANRGYRNTVLKHAVVFGV